MKILVFGLPYSGKSILIKRLGTRFIHFDNCVDDRLYEPCKRYDVIFEGVFHTKKSRELFDADFSIFMNTIKDSKEYFEAPLLKEYDMVINDFIDISISEILYSIDTKRKAISVVYK